MNSILFGSSKLFVMNPSEEFCNFGVLRLSFLIAGFSISGSNIRLRTLPVNAQNLPDKTR